MAQRRPYPITLDERRLATQLSRFPIPPPRSLRGQQYALGDATLDGAIAPKAAAGEAKIDQGVVR